MSSAFALPYHCNRMWQPIGSTFPTSHAPFPFALDVAVSSHAVKVRFVEVSSPSRNLTDIMFCYAESHRTSDCSCPIHRVVVARFIGRRGTCSGPIPIVGGASCPASAINHRTTDPPLISLLLPISLQGSCSSVLRLMSLIGFRIV